MNAKFFLNRRMVLKTAVLSGVAHLTACGGGGGDDGSAGDNGADDKEPSASDLVVGVAGNGFTLNGKSWLPRGVMIRGFVAPPEFLRTTIPKTYNGRLHYGQAELDAAKRFGADTLRFQIGQPSLDVKSPLYDATYVRDVIDAILLARRNGFVVNISMQDGWRSGEPNIKPFATAHTVRNWDMLNEVFGQDKGAIFELYNEPQARATAANWKIWRDGSADESGPDAPVGMQTLLDRLRERGSKNVIIVDGLDWANTLEGVLPLADPLEKVVYAVHPYLHGRAGGKSDWDRRFGNISARLPVYANEWSAGAGSKLGLDTLPSYRPAVDLLNYLRDHGIALSAGEFDVEGVLVQEVPGWIPTNYDGYTSADNKGNVGQLVHNAFISKYSRPLTMQDALSSPKE
ncbi:glycoside hydrolase family 5 protein [Caldimonas brevitalea]|uniref:glycoside hydrolase family 5 protein n=1 Tax=Caldimonas brevitalea TaxID=413882 RepID=UPI00146FF94E|nr:cellulase family glycosylhydrolase [Caldimonas brevitalea]